MALLARPGEIRFWLIINADDPDDAAEPDDLDDSDNSDDSDDSLMTLWASCPGCKRWSWLRYPRPGQGPKSG